MSVTKQGTEEQALEYIQINHKNKIEELSLESQINESMNLLNSLTLAEENIGGEINKFFLCVLPENKEGDALKVISSIASKSKIDKKFLFNSINDIMNKPETNTITLTKELTEQLSVIIKEIFKKIKKKPKIKTFADLKQKCQDYLPNFNQDDILKKYKIQFPAKSKGSQGNNTSKGDKNHKSTLKIKSTDTNLSSSQIKYNSEGEILYKYKEFKEDKNNILPAEMIILMRKFNMVKKLKLTINNDYNSNYEEGLEYNNSMSLNNIDTVLDQNDLQNNILILLNLEWLFINLVELEVDLSNDNLIESEINLYNYSLTRFSDLIHKEIKITTYQNNPNYRRNNDLFQKSLFSQMYYVDEDDQINDKLSSSITNTSLNYSMHSNTTNPNISSIMVSDNIIQKNIDEFNKKYKILLEKIIIYAYFIRNMATIIRTKFTLPLNLGDEIFEMLKKQKIFINDFHFLSFLTNKDIVYLTVEFNSLDNQTFEKLLSFLNQNHNISVCNLSFFPPEEYFKTELLFKILQNCDENFKLKKKKKNKLGFNPNIILDLKGNEDLDTFILRKLSDYFEKNLKKLFYFLTIKTTITELGLIFDLPTILNKNGYYTNALMKYFLDLFIFIDNPVNTLKTLILKAENFIFDSRKYPILNDFCDKLHFYLKKGHKLTSLTFQVKFYRIRKIYRFIPYNLAYLSIGSLDYETFNCLVDYLTSSEYCQRTQLSKLIINLNNSVIDINKDKVYESIIRLLTEYPKELTEISLYSFLIISFHQLYFLLIKTNYNTLPNIFMQFSSKSFLKDKEYENKIDYNIDKITSIKADNFIDLYTVNRNQHISNTLVNLMMHLGEKNKEIMQYNIYLNIEKFLCHNEKKKVIIQFK